MCIRDPCMERMPDMESMASALLATAGRAGHIALTVGFAIVAIGIGTWVYLDGRRRYDDDVAALIAVAVAGLLLAGSLPGLVALAVADDAAVQGFPTALRIVPGVVAIGVYLYARRADLGR